MDFTKFLPSVSTLSTVVKSNRAKAISIGTAITLTLFYVVYDSVNKPPRKLRHVPYINYFTYVRAMLRRTPFSQISRKLAMPLITDPTNNGIYVQPDRQGWVVQLVDPVAIKTVLFKMDQFPKAELTMQRRGTAGAKLLGANNILLVSGHEWKKHRKIANPAFHRSMPVNLFGRLTEKLFSVMEHQDLENVQVSKMMERMTLDAIGLAGFDFDFGALDKIDNPWVSTYATVIGGLRDPLYIFFPFLDRRLHWLIPGRRHVHKQVDKFKGMLTEVIKQKRQQLANNRASSIDDNEKDLLTLMIESEMDGEGALSDEELFSNLVIFFIAGHDTTANALSAALYHLAKNPDVQEKAYQEAVRILGDEPKDVLPTVEQIKEMDYINMVMKEAMRVDGPVSALFPRVAVEDCVLANTFIPKGTRLNISIYNAHHNPGVWEDPEKFNPDRFLPGAESQKLAANGLAWLPFSNGGRQCIGMNFSLAEQRVVLSMLLRKFRVSMPENSPHKEGLITNSIGVLTAVDLQLRFTRRY